MNKLYKNKNWLNRKYWDESLFIYQIAKLCNVAIGTISYFMKKHGISCRNKGETSFLWHKIQNKEQMEKYNKTWLFQKYWIEKLSAPVIAKLCNVTDKTIYNWMKKYGINRRNNSESKLGHLSIWWKKHLSESTKKKIGLANKGSKRSEDAKKLMSEAALLRCSDPIYRERMSIIAQRLWSNQRYIKNILKATSRRPTTPEIKLQKLLPENVRYVGNRAWWRRLPDGHMHNPDFKVTGRNKVIEVFGDYWHRNDDPGELKKLYKQAGLDCLIIWEKEINYSPHKIRTRIDNFLIEGT